MGMRTRSRTRGRTSWRSRTKAAGRSCRGTSSAPPSRPALACTHALCARMHARRQAMHAHAPTNTLAHPPTQQTPAHTTHTERTHARAHARTRARTHARTHAHTLYTRTRKSAQRHPYTRTHTRTKKHTHAHNHTRTETHAHTHKDTRKHARPHARGWHTAGTRLARGWRAAGTRLARGWHAAGTRLAVGKLPMSVAGRGCPGPGARPRRAPRCQFGCQSRALSCPARHAKCCAALRRGVAPRCSVVRCVATCCSMSITHYPRAARAITQERASRAAKLTRPFGLPQRVRRRVHARTHATNRSRARERAQP